MLNSIVSLSLILFLLTWVRSDQDSADYFRGFKVVRLKVSTEESLQALNNLWEEGSWDFWTEPALNSTVDVLLSPEQLPIIREITKKFGIEHEVMIDQLDEVVATERRTSVNRVGNRMSWTAYQRLDTIYDWMDSLTQVHKDDSPYVHTEVINIGDSFEGRMMRVLKVSSNRTVPRRGVNKPAIWIDGGVHAREWISPATVSYIASQVIQANLRGDSWATTFDWYFAPCINPDGYEFSHASIQNRFWRKTRSIREGGGIMNAVANMCVGVDGNRNWDFHWGGSGASSNPCAPNYRGREAASEVEVRNVQNFLLERKGDIKLYLSMHSFSQLILLPWGHSYEYADDYDELLRVANRAANRLEKVQGTTYRTGSTPHILYPASGGSHDWAKGVGGIKYSYTVELPDRGFYGFLLPASRITSVGEETVELVRSMAEDMRDIYHPYYPWASIGPTFGPREDAVVENGTTSQFGSTNQLEPHSK